MTSDSRRSIERRRTLRLHDALQKMQCHSRLDTCKWHAVAIMCTGITRMADACVYIVHVGLGEHEWPCMTLRFWSFWSGFMSKTPKIFAPPARGASGGACGGLFSMSDVTLVEGPRP